MSLRRAERTRGAVGLQSDGMARDPDTIYTIGHGARPVEDLIEILRSAGVRLLVDVRTAPGSRRHPQFGRESLGRALPASGIAYEWKRELGGWRRPLPDSSNTALRSPGFRGYADHMQGEEFRVAVSWLIERAAHVPTALMCAESLWWRCHRRLLSDALLVRGWRVVHLMEGRRQDHSLHPAARVQGYTLLYDRVNET